MRIAILGFILAVHTISAQQPPKKFYPVKPVTGGGSGGGGATLAVASTPYFSYALPQGWRVGESGQFALSLVSADAKALTVMVGNAGFYPNYPPQRFLMEKLGAMQVQNLQMGQGRGAQPVAGFHNAVQYDVRFVWRGMPMQGVVKCNITTAYDTAVLAMTAAFSEARQWTAGYSAWLPQVADQISAINGAAFGVRGVMAQNLRNSQEFGEAARRYREWSQKNWQGVTDARNASMDKQREGMRDVLGGTARFSDPYDGGRVVELPNQYQYFWVDRKGNIVGTNDPGANPNQGSTEDWRRLKRQ